MDIQAARAFLHAETRARLGDLVTIQPFVSGDFGRSPDLDRAPLAGLAARYDLDPGIENLGGQRSGPATQGVVKRLATVSLLRGDLAWMPVCGDLVIVTSRQGEPKGRVSAVLDDLPGLIVLRLSAEG